MNSTDHTFWRRARVMAAAAIVLTGLATTAPLAAQGEEAAGSALAAAAGGLVGVVAGGYGNVAIVVAKARFGHYPHSFRDAFGWESTPILVGGGTGMAIGLIDRDLILPWIIGGATGLAAGAGVGYLYGSMAWGDPESRWANAAITAAIGMAIGSTVAVTRAWDEDVTLFGSGSESALRLPLVQVSF